MNWLNMFFQKCKSNMTYSPIEDMYNKNLDAFAGKVIEVIYTSDKTRRCVFFKNNNGLFSYQFEELCQYDDSIDDWRYIFDFKKSLYPTWNPPEGLVDNSLFSLKEDALDNAKSCCYFKQHFNV